MVISLQSISSRATQDLWGSTALTAEDLTAEQLARRRSSTGKLTKRIAGNMKAKADLTAALAQWFSQISQHLMGLVGRVRAIGTKVDEDLTAAVQEPWKILAILAWGVVAQEQGCPSVEARRIDTRVRKIGEEKEKRTKQWEVYAKDMRQKYLKQQQVFQQDMEKLEQEEALARTAGADAAQLVTDIVNRRQRPAPVAVETGPDAWDQLLQTDMEVEEAHGFLAQAQAALSGVPRAPQTSVTAPLLATVGQNAPPGLPPPAGGATAPTSLPSSMPPTAGPAAVPATGMTGVDAAQHGYHALSPGNCTHRVEPFPASPMQTMPARPEEAKSTEPSGADAAKPESAEPPRRPAAPKRTPLKEQAKHSPPQTVTSGVALGQKLESKRAAMQATATLPFRVPPPGTAGPPEPPDTGEPPGPAPPAGIVNDDIEELNSASPGFGNLE
ncbi:hypothetical protein AK812_SmicGene35685 [Symbiodinium microadriaticum]|uniref:Uncharacterized protein n=1 Tax=Symbiodinium microadriaticum TaxID=2951 RepID=A0A1Q9CKV8_SYMMI|nr:hypothetical protein AK812_SmicGene35685 [Symbiodinium microadriaticum]